MTHAELFSIDQGELTYRYTTEENGLVSLLDQRLPELCNQAHLGGKRRGLVSRAMP